MASNDNLRLYVIPFLMGIVWVLSFLISYFSNEDISKEWSFVLKLSSAFNIALLFELLLMIWDIKLSLKNYYLANEKSFKLQSMVVPFCIIAAPFSFLALNGGWALFLYVSILFCAKSGMHHAVVAIDKHKIPAGHGPMEAI